MVEERYCSYEVSTLLKEKGFDIGCYGRYSTHSKEFHFDATRKCENHDLFTIAAPTHQMAIKWLREKGIYITIVYGDYPSLNKVFWTPQINSLKEFDLPDDFYEDYDEYEDAVEAALKHALENLI
jgi:hypothetical protein